MLWHVWESARQVCKELSRKYGDYKGSFGSGNLKVLSLKPSKDYVDSSPTLDTPNVKILFSMLKKYWFYWLEWKISKSANTQRIDYL